ncbi:MULTISPECIES: tyrosine-type recombinase/integrase [unclassified Streptomyces]|uniref:tyrosine-type recombinase/integrase n=1 Tax=unclassified Streptomyces TaxID=2593676 RepID=UPI00278BB682|nr:MULTISPECIES: tyrosine-type recombinase/integrase [unclassified Streptomyces]
MTNTELSVSTSTTDRQLAAPAPGPRFAADVEDRLAALDREATAHVEDHRPEKTKKGYGADWGAWLRFCAERDVPPAAVRTGTLVAFTEWCWTQPGQRPGTFLAPSTIDRRLSGVVVTARRLHKLQLSKDVAEEARALLKAKTKALAKTGQTRGRGPAKALLVRHMEKVAAALPANRFGVRDLALMTLHFAVAGREHELAHLRVRDIAEDPEGRGLTVDIRVSKVKPRKVAVPFGSRAHLCPVRAWRRWRAELGPDADPDSFAFRAVHNRWKTVLESGLDPETVGDILTRIGARAELDVRITGHSPRRGLVTESSRAGNPDAVMEAQGGWAKGSKVMRGYREEDDAFKENALHGVL